MERSVAVPSGEAMIHSFSYYRDRAIASTLVFGELQKSGHAVSGFG
jgi:hypothetical protein